MAVLFPVLVALCFFAWAVMAATLQGQWEISAVSQPSYVGTVLIDADRRVVWDAPKDRGRPAKFRGYVARVEGDNVKIILTDGASVVHMANPKQLELLKQGVDA